VQRVDWVIPFTDIELQTAWRENQGAAKVGTRTNAHRLLLFYSVECGLKAVLLKRQSKDCTDSCPELREVRHDINKLGSSLPFMLNQQTRCQDNILLTQKFRKFLKP